MTRIRCLSSSPMCSSTSSNRPSSEPGHGCRVERRCRMVPWGLWEAYGDRSVLEVEEQFDSITGHARRLRSKLSSNGLRDAGFQFGDWLHPRFPGPAVGGQGRHRDCGRPSRLTTLPTTAWLPAIAPPSTRWPSSSGSSTRPTVNSPQAAGRAGGKAGLPHLHRFAGTPSVTDALTDTVAPQPARPYQLRPITEG